VDLDLGELAAEAARGVGHAFADLEVRVEVELPPLRVRVDQGRLRQVLANLLANAGQAGARRVDVLGRAAGGVARVEIRDDGPGIPEDLRTRLFDPFATGRPGGTGLGLAISRRIVERHGGALVLVDDPRPGATFELRLPLSPG
jgi:signal transduction histidine kinase